MIVYMAVREVTALNFLIDNIIVSSIVFAIGAVLVVLDLLFERNCLKGKAQDMLILFLIVCIISSILNIKLGIFKNLKFIATLIIQFFVFFCFAKGDSKEELTKKLNRISATLIITLAIIVLCSVLMYFFSIDITIIGKGAFGEASQGFNTQYLRLWGILQDPNSAGSTIIITIFASLRFILISKNLTLRILNALNILLQLSYIILGGSRSSMILLYFAIIVFAVYKFILSKKQASSKNFLKNA